MLTVKIIFILLGMLLLRFGLTYWLAFWIGARLRQANSPGQAV